MAVYAAKKGALEKLMAGRHDVGGGKSVVVQKVVEVIARDAVAAMMRRVGGAFNVQHVILAGGGAFLFKKAVRQVFSTHQILEVKEPMFANVRGYQVAGTNFAQSVLVGTSRPRAAAAAGEGA